MQPKALRLLGLARRAGQLACGVDAVILAAGRAKLILLANDAGNSARREAERLGKQIIVLPYNKEVLGRAAGMRTCAIAAVIDEAFSRGVSAALSDDKNGGT